MARLRFFLLGLAMALSLPVAAGAPLFDREHAAWTALLKQHVHWNANKTSTSVDYDGFQRDRHLLDIYLANLASITPSQYQAWPQPDREAFLINAYNAATVRLILTKYPNLTSIKDLGGLFSSPWKRSFVALLGQTRSLDDIEHGLLRGATEDRNPRTHFAVNCASLGCPALRDEAYVGARLDAQLNDQARRFLRDRTRNRFDRGTRHLLVSRIFDWYGADFDRAGGVGGFLAGYADALGMTSAEVADLRAGRIGIGYLPYDWSLNRRRP